MEDDYMLNEKLKRTLGNFSDSNRAFGGDGQIDRKKLREELNQINHRTSVTFMIAAVMTVIVFVLLIVLAVVYRESIPVLSSLLGALGVTVTGSISAMRGLAKEMAQTNLIVALSGELTGEDMKLVIEALLNASKKG